MPYLAIGATAKHVPVFRFLSLSPPRERLEERSDGVVVNVTKEDIWVREGILPDYPNVRSPQFNFDDGQLVVPLPRNKREDIQEPFVREQEVDPSDYYPEGYQSILLEEWPVESDLVVNLDTLPPALERSKGENWRDRQAYKKHISELTADTGPEE
jgi:hypothetical protein